MNMFSVLSSKGLFLFFLGGLSTGLPGVLTWQTLNIWLAQLGLSKSLIGLVFISGAPYNLKIFLSWIVDKFEIPHLTPRFGQRRAWAIFLQFFLACTVIGLGQTTGNVSIGVTIGLCFMVSMLSAMNQITTVAHRIEQQSPMDSAPGVAAGIFGYRIGKFLGRAGALYLLHWLAWSDIYKLFGLCLFITMGAYMWIEDPIDGPTSVSSESADSLASASLPVWREMITEPFEIFSKNHTHWRAIVGLLCTLNLGDAFIVGMVDLFYLEQGYTTLQIASITKGFGLICSILGGGIAIYASKTRKMYTLLWLSSLIHLSSHALLILLSLYPPHWSFLATTVMVDYLSSGMKTTLIATWIGQLCTRYGLTGRQYAFFSSLKAIPFFIVAAASGFMADRMIWPVFFAISFSLALPSFILLIALRACTLIPSDSETQPAMVQSSYVTQ